MYQYRVTIKPRYSVKKARYTETQSKLPCVKKEIPFCMFTFLPYGCITFKKITLNKFN